MRDMKNQKREKENQTSIKLMQVLLNNNNTLATMVVEVLFNPYTGHQ